MQHCKINHIKHDMTVSSASSHQHIQHIQLSAAPQVAQSSRHIVCSCWQNLVRWTLQVHDQWSATKHTSNFQTHGKSGVKKINGFDSSNPWTHQVEIHVGCVSWYTCFNSFDPIFIEVSCYIYTVVIMPDLEISNSHIHTRHLSCWIHPCTKIPQCLRHRADKTWYSQNWRKPWIWWGHPGNRKSVQETMRAIYLHLLN